MPVTIPLIRSNGTSRTELLSQLTNALEALQAADAALAAATPHGRDYYPVESGWGDFAAASEQHTARRAKPNEISFELAKIADCLI